MHYDKPVFSPELPDPTSRRSHDQPLLAIDSSTYQPRALYQHPDNPRLDLYCSVPEPNFIQAPHDNGPSDYELALTASVNDYAHDVLPACIFPEVAACQPELKQPRHQSLPLPLPHIYASPPEHHVGNPVGWNHEPENLPLASFRSTDVSSQAGWLQQPEAGLSPVFYWQGVSQSGVYSAPGGTAEVARAGPSMYAPSSQQGAEGVPLLHPILAQPDVSGSLTQHQQATRYATIPTAFTENSYHPNPALRALLEYIYCADFILHHTHEPVLADDYSICALAHISSLPSCPSITFGNLSHSLFSIFVDRSNYCCLFCGSRKSSLARVLGCVRTHLGHRPFNCTGCQSCDVINGYAKFSTAALLRDHLNGQEKKTECVRCHTKLRRGGMKRHWKSMHKGEGFPFQDYPRYRQGEATPAQSTPSSCVSPPCIDEA